MDPDKLRELAHQLETGLDVVHLAEQMDLGLMTHQQMEELVVKRLEASMVPGKHIVCIASAMANVGLRLKAEQQSVVDALQGPLEPLGPDHRAAVLEFPRGG